MGVLGNWFGPGGASRPGWASAAVATAGLGRRPAAELSEAVARREGNDQGHRNMVNRGPALHPSQVATGYAGNMISFDTDGLQPRDRFDQWREVRGKALFGVTIEVPRERRRDFYGRFSRSEERRVGEG